MTMQIDISVESQSILNKYAIVPSSFESNIIFEATVPEGGIGGICLKERLLSKLFRKDYDAIEGEGPTSWPLRFDLSNWGFLVARKGGEVIGGAAVAYNTHELNILEGRLDLAVLWDIRVTPKYQRNGIGRSLFQAAEQWAISNGCRTLKIETQNNNVPACKFYIQRGCELGAINRFAYPKHPDEVQLLWYKTLKKHIQNGVQRDKYIPQED